MNPMDDGRFPYDFMCWQRVAGSLIVPGEVVGKPPEWFHFDADNNLRFKTRDNPFHGEEIPPRKFLLPRQDFTVIENWDVIGLSADNVLVGAGGKAYRVDNGGSLRLALNYLSFALFASVLAFRCRGR